MLNVQLVILKKEILGPVVLNKKHRLSRSSGNGVKKIDNARNISLLHKLMSSSKDDADLSVAFHRHIITREKELNIIKTTKGNNHVRIDLKIVFVFAEYHENATYGLGSNLTLQRSSDNHVLCQPAGVDDDANRALAGAISEKDISWYVPHHSPNTSQQNLELEHFVSRIQRCKRIIK